MSNSANGSVDVPSYADLFPELEPSGKSVTTSGSLWSTPVGALKPSTTTQVFQIAVEEQKISKQPGAFPGNEARQMRQAIQDVMQQTGTQIDLSHSRDDTLCVVVSGKATSVEQAKLLLLRRLQKQAEKTIVVPKEHFATIIGRKGEKLKKIQDETGTRVKIPSADSQSNEVVITGTVEGVNNAAEKILDISDKEAKRDRVKLEILKAYQALIAGYKNETLKRIQQATGANIHFPPPSKDIDEVVVSGEKVGVQQAVAELEAIYDVKRATCGELIAQVQKSKHKYIIGPRGSHLDEIMEEFCVVVEMPNADTDSETITLRGPQDQLVHALTRMYELAGSMTADTINVPGWLHKHIIGRKGSNLAKLTENMKKVQINFTQENDLVELEGPPEEVNALKAIVSSLARELVGKMSFEEIRIKPEYHSRIIGKSGAIIGKIKKDTLCQVNFPAADAAQDQDLIRIEGPPDQIKVAAAQIQAIADKLRDSRKIDVIIPQKYHSSIIGKDGAQIKKMIAEVGDITINVPGSKTTSEVITLAGHKDVVAAAETFIKKFVKTIELEMFSLTVSIYKPYHGNVIGKSGVVINKIKTDTKTKIDIPDSKSDSEVITITGLEANCKKAKDLLIKIQDDIAEIVTQDVAVESKCQSLLSGKALDCISRDNGGVVVKPSEDRKGPMIVRGPVVDVKKAVATITEIAADQVADGGSATIKIPRKFHKILIGKAGATAAALQSEHGVKLFFPGVKSTKDEEVLVLGKSTNVAKAKAAIEEKVKALENTVEKTIEIAEKYRKAMSANRAAFLQELRAEFGVDVQLPKSSDGDTGKMKGPSDAMEKVEAKISEFKANVDAQVTIECTIAQKDQRTVIGAGGQNIRKVTEEFKVRVDFPDKQGTKKTKANGADGGDSATSNSTVKITGLQQNCDWAAAALLALVPVEEVMEIDPSYHRFIIGAKGEGARTLREKHDVSLKFPDSSKKDPKVVLRGIQAKIDEIRTVLEEKVKELDADKAERELRNFKVQLSVNPKLHQRLIGKAGANVIKLREQFEVQIDFPDKKKKLSKDDAKKIVVRGYEDKAKACADAISEQVKEFESLVNITLQLDPRCFRKIIGKKGENIRSMQSKFKVQIRMPRDDGGTVKIEGPEELALDCKDALLDIEEEFMQDQDEYAEDMQYVKPSRYDTPKEKKKPAESFGVKNAPWQAPTEQTFPGLGSSASSSEKTNGNTVWGGAR